MSSSVMSRVWPVARRLLFGLDPERAHGIALSGLTALERAHLLAPLTARAPDRPIEVCGLRFPNAVGLAAGLDKNGAHIDALAALGFGFIEVGTTTPRPQPGNPRPRLFRIPEARALVNRMGFNNDGVDALVENVRRARYRGVLGINIGKNFDTPIERAADDYLACLRKVYPLASYVTVNISSPNTKNLRALQQSDELDALLKALAAERAALGGRLDKRVPIALKIAPDLDEAAIEAIADRVVAHGIDMVIATNTTIQRDGVEGLAHAGEAGGLSGAPLHDRARAVVGRMARALGGRAVLIAAGGILSVAEARAMHAAGARLVQVYTGLIYRGPALVEELVRGFPEAARAASTPVPVPHA
jgi:dihydroorotate dehydrogenase